MALFCMNCNRGTNTIPCEHCGGREVNIFTVEGGEVEGYIYNDNSSTEPTTDEGGIHIEFSAWKAEWTFELTPEQAEQLNRGLPKFDVSQFVGIPCATCGEPFTQAFFGAGGTMIRTGDDRWQHDHCRSEN